MQKTYKHLRMQLRMHPIHFHIGMYVATAALLITAMKSSEGMLAVLYPTTYANQNNFLHDTQLREAETHIGHARLGNGRYPSISGI